MAVRRWYWRTSAARPGNERVSAVRVLYLEAMTRLTIEVPDDVAARLVAVAVERGVTSEQLAAEVVVEAFAAGRRLSFAGIGRSSTGRTAQEAEDMLRDGFAQEASETTPVTRVVALRCCNGRRAPRSHRDRSCGVLR